MPPSSDQPSSYEHPTVDPALCPQEELPRKRSPGRKGQGKKLRKHEAVGENAEERRLSEAVTRPMTSNNSILSPFHAPTSPPEPSSGASPPSPAAWDPTPLNQHSDSPLYPTRDWAKGFSYCSSPPQYPNSKLSIAGSPPRYQSPPEGTRGGFAHVSPSTSPRAAFRQPIQRVSDYQRFGDYLGSSPNNKRPISMQSQTSHYPPPPHHPQAHFYGAPQIDLGLPKVNSEDRRPREVCCCVLDGLFSNGKDGARHPENVLLVGSDHALDIYLIDKKQFDRIGRLNNLRGSVIGAKVLTNHPKSRFQASQLLVMLIIHGPCLPTEKASQPEPPQGEDEDFDATASMLQAMQMADVTTYQTTVEIYSLRTGEHVTNLFRSPKVEGKIGYNGQLTPAPPVGDLRVLANGTFSIIASGSSGEVFVFESILSERKDEPPSFRCIGKTWTRISTPNPGTASTPSSDSDPGGPIESHVRRMNAAILALSDRWLAVLPPPSSSYTTLHGQVNVENAISKIPGLGSHTPPAEPQATCDLDTPKDGSVLNRVARDVAQGALKSAQWVAAEGLQAWNSYWSKTPDHGRIAGSPPSHGFPTNLPPSQNFPPTHAQDNFNDRAKGQPTTVSIIDLVKLSQSQNVTPSLALQPLATFSLPSGCSALSFSPSGLDLLTASAKGDIQHVWDLMRMIHGDRGRLGDPDTAPTGPSVRQVARFSRMTEARIVDVIWAEPKGERFAVVTERGTVHVNDLPSSAFQWPPYRRQPLSTTSPSQENKLENTTPDRTRPQSVGSGLGSAFGMFAGRTQIALASVRGRSPSANSGFPGFGSLAMTAGAGAKGSKAVAAGINRSVSAAAAGTVSTFRHYGENRLALPVSPNSVYPSCAHWMYAKNQGSIVVTAGDTVRIHSIRQNNDPKAGQRRPSIIADKPVEFSLARAGPLPQHVGMNNARRLEDTTVPPGSFWLPQPSRPTSLRPNLDTHPLSYAEIETNAPYQPFHTDRRVNLFVYNEPAATDDPHHLHSSTPWVFGDEISATKISAGSATNEGDDESALGIGRMENEIRMEGNVEDGQRVVSTTTRRKKSKPTDGQALVVDEAEFFEDDFEVLDYAEDRA